MNTYNARVSFSGEGSFDFTLPNYGEVKIYAGKDLYLKGLTQSGVEALRMLRPVLLEHKLNAKPDGCYKVIDLENSGLVNIKPRMEYNYRPVQSTATIADLRAELHAGPISAEELQTALESTKVETAVEKVTTDPGDYILTSTKHKGKKISELTRGQLSGNMPKFNAEDLIAVEAYKDSLKK